MPKPTFSQMLVAVDTLRRYSLYTSDENVNFVKISDQVEASVRRERMNNKKQKLMIEIFE